MWQVENHLVVGVGVDGGHHAVFDTEIFMDDFGHRCQAVGGAGGIGDDVVLGGVVFVFVDSHYDGDVFTLGRSRDDDFFRAGFNVRGSFIGVGEASGRLNDYINSKSSPGQTCRIAFSKYFDRLAVDHNRIFFGFDFGVQDAVDRIVFEQMGQGFCIRQVVDCYDFQRRVGHSRPKCVAADAAKPVNPYFDCHE